MRKVRRESVLSLNEYEKQRDVLRTNAMRAKDVRRIHVGDHLTFLFENHETMLYQIQEMLRAEKTTGEEQVMHEIETYNEIIGQRGELGCTLLIEIDDPQKRDVLLSRWLSLPQSIYLKTQDGAKVRAEFDTRQVGERRISSVHYLKFRLGDKVPVALGCEHPDIALEKNLLPAQSAALCQDLMAQ